MPLRLDAEPTGADDCVEVPATGTAVRLVAPGTASRGPIRLATCAPRGERTPEVVETNLVEIR